MKPLTHSAIVASTLLVALGNAFAQAEPVMDPGQLRPVSPVPAVKGLQAARAATPNASAMPLTVISAPLKVFPYTVTSGRDGLVYSGSIVGADPRGNGARTTNVPVVLIPLAVQLTGTPRLLDPTAPDTGCLGGNVTTALAQVQQSPLFNPVPNYTVNGVNMGNVTFPDAFQRSQFWSDALGNPVVAAKAPYHLGLPVTVAPKQTVTFVNDPNASAASFGFNGDCSVNALTDANPARMAAIDINALDPLLTTIIANLGISPSQFPLFVVYRTFLTNGPPGTLNGNCCILGYHSATSGNPANPGQTYGIAYYDHGAGVFGAGTKDISTLSHEIMEWVNDPSTNNLTPPWGGIGQVSGCQNNFETGDPLSGTLMPAVLMPNGISYHAQEQGYFSWYLDAGFSAAGGKFSSNGTFSGFAKPCPPGGTN